MAINPQWSEYQLRPFLGAPPMKSFKDTILGTPQNTSILLLGGGLFKSTNDSQWVRLYDNSFSGEWLNPSLPVFHQYQKIWYGKDLENFGAKKIYPDFYDYEDSIYGICGANSIVYFAPKECIVPIKDNPNYWYMTDGATIRASNCYANDTAIFFIDEVLDTATQKYENFFRVIMGTDTGNPIEPKWQVVGTYPNIFNYGLDTIPFPQMLSVDRTVWTGKKFIFDRYDSQAQRQVIKSSFDGTHWVVSFFPGGKISNRLKVANGYAYAYTKDDKIFKSIDGKNWDFCAMSPDTSADSISSSGSRIFVRGYYCDFSSENGIVWDTLFRFTPQSRCVWAGDRFYAYGWDKISKTESRTFGWSTNGINWHYDDYSPDPYSMATFSGILASSGTIITTGTDWRETGGEWKKSTTPLNYPVDLVWAEDVFYGLDTTGQVFKSVNGDAWSKVEDAILNDVAPKKLIWTGTSLLAFGFENYPLDIHIGKLTGGNWGVTKTNLYDKHKVGDFLGAVSSKGKVFLTDFQKVVSASEDDLLTWNVNPISWIDWSHRGISNDPTYFSPNGVLFVDPIDSSVLVEKQGRFAKWTKSTGDFFIEDTISGMIPMLGPINSLASNGKITIALSNRHVSVRNEDSSSISIVKPTKKHHETATIISNMGNFKISLPFEGIYSIKLFTLAGRVLYNNNLQTKNKTVYISIADISKGCAIITITDNRSGYSVSQKVLVN